MPLAGLPRSTGKPQIGFTLLETILGKLIATAIPIAAGAAIGPLLSRVVLPPAKSTFLRDQLPYTRVASDGKTVEMLGRKGGGLFRVIQLRGEIYSGLSAEEIEALFGQRLAFYRGLADQPVQLRVVSQRSHLSVTPPPVQDGLTDIIDKRWHTRFENAYTTDHYMILSVPSGDQRKRLDNAQQLIFDMFARYNPTVLENGDETYSPLLSFLASYINGVDLTLGSSTENIADRLPFSNIEFSRDGLIKYTDGPNTLYQVAIGIKAWPENSTAEVINGLLRIPGPITVILKATPFQKADADTRILSRSRQAKLAVYNPLISKEWQEAKEKVGAAQEAFYQAELTAYASAPDLEQLENLVAAIRTSLASHAIRVVRETMLAERLWWGRLPGHEYFTRDYHLLSSNLADFTPLPAEPRGRDSSQWGPRPIRYFPTASGSPYGFVFHKSPHEDLAHWLVIGPSGRGKSTLIMFLIFGALSAHPNLRAFVFDRMLGTKNAFDCYGGDYLIPEDPNLPLNPFLADDGSPEYRNFLELWLRMLLGRHDDEAVNHITTAVQDIMSSDPGNRSLAKQLNHVFGPGELRNGLKKWATSSRYGRIFNGSRDALSLTGSRLVGFDMTAMQEDTTLGAAMTFYFMQRIRQLVLKTPTPHIAFIDEAPAQLRDEFFASNVEVLFREHRKLQGSIILAAQDAGAFTKIKIAETLLNNTAGVIFFQNERTVISDLDSFQLQPEEREFILGRSDVAKRFPRSVLIKKGEESVILDINLSALGPYLRSLSSSIEDRKVIQDLKQQYGETQWLPHFIPL